MPGTTCPRLVLGVDRPWMRPEVRASPIACPDGKTICLKAIVLTENQYRSQL